MRVYFNGFNLHRQLPADKNIVESLTEHEYTNKTVKNIEVSYYYSVLLVADSVILKGAKDGTFHFQQEIKQICCNEDKVLILTTNGDLFKLTDTLIQVPKLPNLENEDVIERIALGSKILVLLTKNGFLYNFHNKLDFNSTTIIEVKCGREHCIILNASGNVYTFGRGSRGQLGHGCLNDVAEPKLVEALGGIKIKKIAAGGWHCCAVSYDGDIYVWGWNNSGQLGISDIEQVVAIPAVVDLNCNVLQVGCGNKHTVVLSEDKKLWGCGWNKYKQLTKSDDENIRKMILLYEFPKENIDDVRCGPWNTIVLVK